jgi:NAD(P)-dependent dehydrogenase (short-subunit alcohol dehydrogenase family)/uncharacterized OB-fold protein
MIPPLVRPKRKNPLPRTRLPLLPPAARSRAALGLTAAAALGCFNLQVCANCGAVQYPPREACHVCLSLHLSWRTADGLGELIADTTIRHSHEPFFRKRLPWRIGMVQLDAGPTVIAHLHSRCAPAPARVRLSARLDKSGQGVLVAFPIDEESNMSNDPQLREMTCHPQFRKVLVTDGKTAVGQALVRALIGAGAQIVWVGHAQPWHESAGLEELRALPQATLLPLDVTDSDSVRELAAEIGGRTDILINNAEIHRTYGIEACVGIDHARAEMDVNYFGLLRLAQEFGPAMRAHSADGHSNAVAWVNLLSVFALSNFPAHGTFSASKAAAYSLSQCLRAEMRPAGIRVITVFPGPLEDEWNQALPPPKLTAEGLARAVVGALEDGIEDVYPGDFAQEWLARWEENPKVLESELSA